jgi:hypothetical protein
MVLASPSQVPKYHYYSATNLSQVKGPSSQRVESCQAMPLAAQTQIQQMVKLVESKNSSSQVLSKVFTVHTALPL